MTNDEPKPSMPMSQGYAANKVRGVTEEIKGAAGDVAREARAAGEAVREVVAGLGNTIKQDLTDQLERQKNGIADRLNAVAKRGHETAGDLRDQEAWLGDLLARGADELADIANEIRRNNVAGLLGSVEVFARRQPALFMGAAVALGFALTRFVGGGPTDSDIYRQNIGRSDYGRADYSGPDLGRPYAIDDMPQARRPMMDSVVGGGNI